MKEIKEDIKEIKKNLQSVDKTLVKQEENLKHHMYRTELAEKRLAHIETDIKPVKRHVAMLEGGLKLLGVLAVIAGILKATGVI